MFLLQISAVFETAFLRFREMTNIISKLKPDDTSLDSDINRIALNGDFSLLASESATPMEEAEAVIDGHDYRSEAQNDIPSTSKYHRESISPNKRRKMNSDTGEVITIHVSMCCNLIAAVATPVLYPVMQQNCGSKLTALDLLAIIKMNILMVPCVSYYMFCFSFLGSICSSRSSDVFETPPERSSFNNLRANSKQMVGPPSAVKTSATFEIQINAADVNFLFSKCTSCEIMSYHMILSLIMFTVHHFISRSFI